MSSQVDVAGAARTLMTVAEAIELGTERLHQRAGVDARREAIFLLSGLLGTTPGQVVLSRDARLSARQVTEYHARLGRRALGEPLQYVEGRASFRSLELQVGPAVLIPRPETEELVGQVLTWCAGREGLVGLDIGTGSGAIAISLAVEGPFERVVAVDISGPALEVARVNAESAGVADRVWLRRGSVYEALHPNERFDVVVSNPPYVAEAELDALPEDVRDWEPAVALYAGPTGLEIIVEIVGGARKHLKPGGLLALEIAPGLAMPAERALVGSGAFGDPRVLRDLAGRERMLLANLKVS